MNIYENIKSNLQEFTEDSYGDRTYDYDEAVSNLETLCKKLNDTFKAFEYNFDWRIERGNLVIYDSNEYFDYEDSNFDSVDKIVKSVFGKHAYLEPENSVIMCIAGAYLAEAEVKDTKAIQDRILNLKDILRPDVHKPDNHKIVYEINGKNYFRDDIFDEIARLEKLIEAEHNLSYSEAFTKVAEIIDGYLAEGIEDEDIHAYLHHTSINTFGDEIRSVSRHYGKKDILLFCKIWNKDECKLTEINLMAKEYSKEQGEMIDKFTDNIRIK